MEVAETNGKLILPEKNQIEFEYTNAEGERTTAKIDVVEAQFAIDAALEDSESITNVSDRVKSAVITFQRWINDTFKHQLAFADAWAIYTAVQDGFEDFKKKLPPSVRLLTDTKSILEDLTD